MTPIAAQCQSLLKTLEDRAEFVPPLLFLRVAAKMATLRAYISAAGYDPDRMGLGVIASTEGRGDVHDAHQHQAFLTGHLCRLANRAQANRLGYSGSRACSAEQLAQELAEFEPLLDIEPGRSAFRTAFPPFIGPPVPPPMPACPLFEEAAS